MTKFMQILLCALLLCSFAFAGDKSADYQLGSIKKLTTKSEWYETDCSTNMGTTRCTSGDQSRIDSLYIMSFADGTEAVIAHALMRPDTVKGMNLQVQMDGDAGTSPAVKVMYRIQRRAGVNYIIIPDTDGKKEGWYYIDPTFKHGPQKPTTQAPTNASNVTAMCASGKLTPEQQKQLCAAQ
jgi:hypothetical protein